VLRLRPLAEDLSGNDEVCVLFLHDALADTEHEDVAVDAGIDGRAVPMLRVADDVEVFLGGVDDAKRQANPRGGRPDLAARGLPATPQMLDVQERSVDAKSLHEDCGQNAVQATREKSDRLLPSGHLARFIRVLGVLHIRFTSFADDGSGIGEDGHDRRIYHA
jgi:hypothetical protein